MGTSNTLFAIFAASKPIDLGAKLESTYPGMYLKVAEGEWLLVAPSSSTTKEISDILGITDNSVSQAIVVSTAGYFGRASVSIWEWIATKTGATSGAKATT
jgi:hypothetical protein